MKNNGFNLKVYALKNHMKGPHCAKTFVFLEWTNRVNKIFVMNTALNIITTFLPIWKISDIRYKFSSLC